MKLVRSLPPFLLFVFFLVGPSSLPGIAEGAEKLRFATPTKTTPHHNLPPLAAQEQGFWKSQGLEVEWTPFSGGTPMFRALVGERIEMGITATPSLIQAAARGLPGIIVADTHLQNYRWFIYVPSASKIKEARDLKRAKVAVNIFGGTAHAYGRVLAKGLGLEKDIKFVAAGGVAEQIAAIRSGAADATVLPLLAIAPLKVRGDVREVAEATDYLPKPWSEHGVFASRGFTAKKPEVVRKALKALLEATQFIHRDEAWTTERLVSFSLYTPEAAKKITGLVRYGSSFKVDGKAIENVRNFLKEHAIIDKAPAIEELFTNDFVP